MRGQESIKRCMEIAAAGGHNIILIGPPGAGKSTLVDVLIGALIAQNKKVAVVCVDPSSNEQALLILLQLTIDLLSI